MYDDMQPLRDVQGALVWASRRGEASQFWAIRPSILSTWENAYLRDIECYDHCWFWANPLILCQALFLWLTSTTSDTNIISSQACVMHPRLKQVSNACLKFLTVFERFWKILRDFERIRMGQITTNIAFLSKWKWCNTISRMCFEQTWQSEMHACHLDWTKPSKHGYPTNCNSRCVGWTKQH